VNCECKFYLSVFHLTNQLKSIQTIDLQQIQPTVIYLFKPFIQMKRRDYLKNIGFTSLGMAVLGPEVKAAELLEQQKPIKKGAKADLPNRTTSKSLVVVPKMRLFVMPN
jgi:hypothetical protein